MNLYESTFLNEAVRLQSFKNWPISHIVTPKNLARAGFCYLNDNNSALCIYCNGLIDNWESGDDPDMKHIRLFPNCPFVQSVILPRLEIHEDDVAISTHLDGAIQRELHVNIRSKPQNNDYDTFESRLRTFGDWPQALAQTPGKLADAGFFYMGFGDAVECFSCGICFRDWEPQDDPWIEHAKASPHCNYMLKVKGGNFVKRCRSTNLNNNENAANTLSIDLETSEKQIVNISASIGNTSNPSTIVNGIKDTSSSANLFGLKEVETLIKEAKACKICLSEEAVIVFLPCSHLVACVNCASKLKNCPVCRTVINKIIRAFPA
ncbi:hypothetical protein ILUMI_01898 [Ignelater luminosus]|uniref:RING-type domain-containing protein n=1 Tax=Ignelater luminosus TaxID=2038154 RepID=A0A8K0DHK1_IGNLU|nr:hypothetical protein ILUMI_01898 [Ignelater luminosus]